MAIIECTKAFLEAVAKANLSPPLRFGRVVAKETPGSLYKGSPIDRVFVGLCSDEDMKRHVMLIESSILQGGNVYERRIRGLS